MKLDKIGFSTECFAADDLQFCSTTVKIYLLHDRLGTHHQFQTFHGFFMDFSAHRILKNLRIANVNHLICAQLNIYSISNKSKSLKEFVSTNVGILLICETKLDLPFPRAQFNIHSFGEAKIKVVNIKFSF